MCSSDLLDDRPARARCRVGHAATAHWRLADRELPYFSEQLPASGPGPGPLRGLPGGRRRSLQVLAHLRAPLWPVRAAPSARGAPALECGKRELFEETGYTAKEWFFLARIHPVIGYATEFIDIYVARGLQPGTRHLDAEEFLDVFAASLQEMRQWIDEGTITDVKTIISVYHLMAKNILQ